MADYTDEYFTNTDGLKQHYRDYNVAPDGAPLVLCMPGLTRNAKDFGFIADHLKDRCRLICVEQRGRGWSEWDPDPSRYAPNVYVEDMMALLQHLDVAEIITIGTSLGGLMTIMMNALYPGVIKAAVINDIGPEIDPAGIARIKSYVGVGTPPATWEEAVEAVKFANRGVYPKFSDQDWLMVTHLLYEDKDGRPAAQYDPALRKNFDENDDQAAPDLWPLFAQMHSIPMVVLRGGISDILSATTLQRMATEHPDLVPVTVPDMGHVPLMREPEVQAAIDGLIDRFL
ncbi:MAG: alpha/beta hydrolase [Kordiimonadaceae bacterium]|nr:alpha/beta hydrolase [Kordiimonadaceae bacterium]MBO6570059.1 alpha/beta hydrolase [Kordiimonadaceae bacterium]MBO6965844.1 alpha/beta hydrolase [Kordiimonadaceae bacterium]